MNPDNNDYLNILTGIWSMVCHSPVWVIILLVLNLVGAYLQWSSFCPNKLVPPLLVALGIVLNCTLGSVTDLAANQRHPVFVLGMLGFLIGAAAYGLHETLLQWFIRKFKIKDQDGNPLPAKKPADPK